MYIFVFVYMSCVVELALFPSYHLTFLFLSVIIIYINLSIYLFSLFLGDEGDNFYVVDSGEVEVNKSFTTHGIISLCKTRYLLTMNSLVSLVKMVALES